MNKVSCDVCLDLIPLVKDDVASKASKNLVEEHIETCDECKILYDSFEKVEMVMDEKGVVRKIKKQVFIVLLFTIVIASMVGLGISETMGMFYNILIMPSIGILGYFALNKKAHFVPISLFIFSYIWLLIKYIGEGMFKEGLIAGVFIIPIYWGGIYAGLCAVGVFIGFLLKYAFGKENIYEN